MAKIIVYIGKKRNEKVDSFSFLEKSKLYTVVNINDITNNVNDLRCNIQKLYNNIAEQVEFGEENIIVKNIEVLIPHYFTSSVYNQIKKHYPDNVTFIFTTCLPWYCWGSNEIHYEGDKENMYNEEQMDIAINRIKWGNILDAFGTGLLEP